MAAEATKHDVSGTVFDTDAVEIARSYAQAFLNLIEESGRGESVLQELEELVSDVWDANPEFAAMIGGGFLQEERREELLRKVLDGRADELVARFVRVVNRRDRLSLLPQIAQQARQLWDRQRQVIEVEVRSAVPLDDAQQLAILDRLRSQMPGRNPRLSTSVDPNILGGLILQIGDQMLDASLRTRLQKVREQIVSGQNREIRARRDELTQG
jgi:F-type H+-transporting ATPase subunit delta